MMSLNKKPPRFTGEVTYEDRDGVKCLVEKWECVYFQDEVESHKNQIAAAADAAIERVERVDSVKIEAVEAVRDAILDKV